MQPALYIAWDHLTMCECGCKVHGVALSRTDVHTCTEEYKSVQTSVLAECSVAAAVLEKHMVTRQTWLPADGGLRVAATKRMH